MEYNYHSNKSFPKIALVFHVFYFDMVPDILGKIFALTQKFDLFITTPNEDIANYIMKQAEQTGNFTRCDIIITPNRGRNFAPMLVEIGPKLLEYDFICHIHTKKSFHTKKFAHWGNYLIAGTIGNSAAVSTIISKFTDFPRCGLIYPTRFSEIPCWSQHWLSNYKLAKDWCRTFALHISDGSVEFPTGGMFWARPNAIWQLLSFKWTYDDFPVELGQIDGTMHHAVERLVGVIAAQNGYYHLEFNAEQTICAIEKFRL